MVASGTSLYTPDVIVGTTICRRTSFVLNKFLANQQEIQQSYPKCSLILATDEPDFATELRKQIHHYHLRGEVIAYETVKPGYARSHLWSITCGREAIRQYVLAQGVEYLLFVDGDIVFEASVVNIMKDKSRGFDIVWSGYRFPPKCDLRFGAGCVMIRREILNKIPFRCYEFSNGELIFEDELFDLDSFKRRARVDKGIFVPMKHYLNKDEYCAIAPQPLSWFRKLTNCLVVRYALVRMSIAVRHNIPSKLHALLYRTPGSSAKLFSQTKCGERKQK